MIDNTGGIEHSHTISISVQGYKLSSEMLEQRVHPLFNANVWRLSGDAAMRVLYNLIGHLSIAVLPIL